ATPATTWLTPERRTRLQGLLDQGGEWLAAQPRDLPERELYACHLRRLLPALEALQREFAKTAALLQRQRSQLQAARDWAGAQPRRHDAHLRKFSHEPYRTHRRPFGHHAPHPRARPAPRRTRATTSVRGLGWGRGVGIGATTSARSHPLRLIASRTGRHGGAARLEGIRGNARSRVCLRLLPGK